MKVRRIPKRKSSKKVDKNSIGFRMEYLRTQELELTQEEFADKTGLTKGYISLLESNSREVTRSVLDAIVQMTSVNENWLLTGEGNVFNRNLPSRREIILRKIGQKELIDLSITEEEIELLVIFQEFSVVTKKSIKSYLSIIRRLLHQGLINTEKIGRKGS
jgi:transcriptional regulator with XRE-family HTH domain